MTATRIILVRHGETVWNTEEREMGQLDSPLTAKGLRQAELLAIRLGSVDFTSIYSSDLNRAYLTASRISEVKKIGIQKEPRLRERNMGIFQGLTVEEMRIQFPVERKRYEETGFEYIVPNGESAHQKVDRTVACLSELALMHAGESILCVTHGGILMGFFQYVLGLQPDSGARFKRPNAAINIFEYRDHGWVLETWGDVGHLEGIGTLDDGEARFDKKHE